MSSDGSNQELLLPAGAYGWELQGHGEWSPDGWHLVMIGGRRINPQIFVTDFGGKQLRQVTCRDGTNIDPSWSSDGRTILFISCPSFWCTPSRYELFKIAAAGGTAERLTSNSVPDYDPFYSPDATHIAWLSNTIPSANGGAGAWDIMKTDGLGAHGNGPTFAQRNGPSAAKSPTLPTMDRLKKATMVPRWAMDPLSSLHAGHIDQVEHLDDPARWHRPCASHTRLGQLRVSVESRPPLRRREHRSISSDHFLRLPVMNKAA